MTLATAVLPARSHEYPVQGFKIIHPWCHETPSGTPELAVSLRIVEVAAADRLISASTPVAETVEMRPPSTGGPAPAGIALRPGEDLSLSPATPHLVLRGVNTDLHFGREYPLTLVFERAGEVPAALIVGEH